MKLPGLVAAVGLLAITAGARAAVPGDFPFHPGDRVVFLGDSITEQKLYTTYIETYLLTRFPTWNLQFRNAGWGGDTSWLRTRGVPSAEALKRDVIDLHPTVVTIDFGMNDAGYKPFDQALYNQHYKGETDIVEGLKKAGIRPIVLTASAVEKTEPGDDMIGYNQSLEQFGAGDREIANAEGVPFADQLHPFIAAINRLRAQAGEKARLSADTVHPGPPGHLMMADFILTGLNAPPLVSAATVDAGSGRVSELSGARIANVVRKDGGVSFKRQDDALVFPIEASARPVLQIVPVVQDLDRYMLRVTGLKPGDYSLSVNGQHVANFSQAELSDGVNLANYQGTPLTDQGSKILAHVYTKNNEYFDLWRNVQLKNPPDMAARTADLNSKIADEERAINALRVPLVYDFSITPVTPIPAPKYTG